MFDNANFGSDNGLSLFGAKPLSEQIMVYQWLDIGKKSQWNLYQNMAIFIQANAFQNVIYKMAVILSQSRFVQGVEICMQSVH